QALVPSEAEPQEHIDRAVGGDDGKAGPERDLEIEAVMDHQHRRRLAEHGEPAQAHQRVEPHAAHGMLLLFDSEVGHPAILSASRCRDGAGYYRRASRLSPCLMARSTQQERRTTPLSGPSLYRDSWPKLNLRLPSRTWRRSTSVGWPSRESAL